MKTNRLIFPAARLKAALVVVSGMLAGAGIPPLGAQTLLLRYNFDESATGTEDALDKGTAPAAPGRLINAARTPNTSAGRPTGALETTGAAAGNLRYVVSTDQSGELDKLDGLSGFTLTAWINVQEVPLGNRRLLSKQAATSFAGFSWNIADAIAGAPRTAANFGLRLFVGGETGFVFDSTAVTIDADNKWVFTAVSYDGDLNFENVRYYVGNTNTPGAFQAATTINAGRTRQDSTAAFGIGYTDAAPASNTGFPGLVDDARVYSGVLSDSQIEAVRLENLQGPATGTPVVISSFTRQNNTSTLGFPSRAGLTYRVEFNDSLAGPWQPLTTVAGIGATLTVSDSTATPARRFYRVVTQ